MTLRRLKPDEIARTERQPVPESILEQAAKIVARVDAEGEPALRELAAALDGWSAEDPLYYDREALERVTANAPSRDLERLERTAERIRSFSRVQHAAFKPVEIEVPGGTAGHELSPIESAGCYAPGGRYPLPSSVLMTVIPARVAGVESVWVASPRPAPVTLWAATVAGADGLLAAGGAQAIAALARGVGPVPGSDVIVGPGNLWVTAAKLLLGGRVAIDLPAGPSELLVIGDETSGATTIAADLLAQAEHDPAAYPLLLTSNAELIEGVDEALGRQLATLPTAEVAGAALANGGAVLCADDDEIVRLANELAPEHLQISVADPERFRSRLRHFGALFIGDGAPEVFGDYGAGPNHVLPTGGAARFSGGLSVLTFLRLRTWMRANGRGAPRQFVDDTIWLAKQEGLEGHARAAARRRRVLRS